MSNKIYITIDEKECGFEVIDKDHLYFNGN